MPCARAWHTYSSAPQGPQVVWLLTLPPTKRRDVPPKKRPPGLYTCCSFPRCPSPSSPSRNNQTVSNITSAEKPFQLLQAELAAPTSYSQSTLNTCPLSPLSHRGFYKSLSPRPEVLQMRSQGFGESLRCFQGPRGQNHFHSKTKTIFAFFTRILY